MEVFGIVAIVIASLIIIFAGGFILWFVIANFILILFILDKLPKKTDSEEESK